MGASEGLGPGPGRVTDGGEVIGVERTVRGDHPRQARRAGAYHREVFDPKAARPGEVVATHVQVQFAIDDASRADRMVEQLLADHLVASGQRAGPVVSRYWWQGVLERSEEWLVLLKTRAELAPAVVSAVVEAHPYETPEVVVVDLAGGARGYLAWIDSVTGPAGTIGSIPDPETEDR